MEQPLSRDIQSLKKPNKPPKPGRLVAAMLKGGLIVETLFDPEQGKTTFCLGQGENWRAVEEISIDGRNFLPYAPDNNLLKHEVVLLPSQPEDYLSEEALLADVKRYLHAWVDLSPLFEEIAAHYILLTWVHDAFNELPYLRVRGDFGSGKTRFLLIAGSVCLRPIFASGASTVSPLFRLLDSVAGTLILDEGDFRASDERAEVVKILNNGNARGFPVLRSEPSADGEYNPRAYSVFGPKIVASRGWFEDRALESRFLTEEMGGRKLRADIPLNLDDTYRQEALLLRNKLLLFRFRRRGLCTLDLAHSDPDLEPRLNQVFAPLLAIAADPALVARLKQLGRDYQRHMRAERGQESSGQMLAVIREMRQHGERLLIKTITARFIAEHGFDFEEPMTARRVGHLLRKLGLIAERTRDGYVLAGGQQSRLDYLFDRHGVVALESVPENDVPENLPI